MYLDFILSAVGCHEQRHDDDGLLPMQPGWFSNRIQWPSYQGRHWTKIETRPTMHCFCWPYMAVRVHVCTNVHVRSSMCMHAHVSHTKTHETATQICMASISVHAHTRMTTQVGKLSYSNWNHDSLQSRIRISATFWFLFLRSLLSFLH